MSRKIQSAENTNITFFSFLSFFLSFLSRLLLLFLCFSFFFFLRSLPSEESLPEPEMDRDLLRFRFFLSGDTDRERDLE